MSQKTIGFLVKVYAVLAICFGLLACFAGFVEWARPVLWIALANTVLTAAMAVMNSILLDRLKEEQNVDRGRP
jgi:hypothetical protein